MTNSTRVARTHRAGYARGQSEKAVWGGFELLDRGSVLVGEGGDPDALEAELAAALQSAIGPSNPRALRAFLNELLPEIGVGSMDELGGESLATVLQGILE